jgi:hypothetical protein
MAQHTVAAVLEALGDDAARVQSGALRLGLVVCLMAGGVKYSRRFYEEVLRDPATASPLVFTETVFNATASHLAAFLGSTAMNYTLVGDEGTFLQGLALAADWLEDGHAEGCVVVGAEETDWLIADAMRLFKRSSVYSGGAGALYLKKDTGKAVELEAITDPFPFTRGRNRAEMARQMWSQLNLSVSNRCELLCDSGNGNPAWQDWDGPRLVAKHVLGEAFVAAAAWQCVAACDAVERGEYAAARVCIVGTNQQAIGARFVRVKSGGNL